MATKAKTKMRGKPAGSVQDFAEAAECLKTLAHPVRLRIVQLLLHGRYTVGELAERLQAKHHGTVALVDRCEQVGLVERKRGREDRRRIEVHLLEKGARLVECIAQRHQPELQLLREEFRLPGWE